jgi:hypothetical protein
MPLDPVEMRDLGSRQPLRRAARARLIAIEALVDHTRADHALARHKAIGAGADDLLDRLIGIGGGKALRHDAQRRRADLRKRLQHHAERPLQADDEGPIVGGRDLVDARHQRLADRIARGPAPDRGHTVAAAHRLPVVEDEPVAQAEGPAPAVVVNAMAFHHLRLRRELAVDAVELVPHHQGVMPSDIGRGNDRIDDRQIGLRHVSEHAGARGLGSCGTRQHGCRQRAGEEATASHILSQASECAGDLGLGAGLRASLTGLNHANLPVATCCNASSFGSPWRCSRQSGGAAARPRNEAAARNCGGRTGVRP